MANKTISELTEATSVNEQDLFVLEQSGLAKKMTAETFITAQNLVSALASALDGHGGISSVALSSVSGRIRTYRMTFTDGTSTTFQVYDGTTIERVAKTSTAGLVDTYTIFMSDGTTTFFTVTNGADGTVSEAMLNDALKDKAPAITETTESSAIATFSDGADNMVMHNVVVEINPVQDLSNGDPSPTNICPITGHTEVNVNRAGKNLIRPAQTGSVTYNGVTLTINEDGSIKIKGTTSDTIGFNYDFLYSNPYNGLAYEKFVGKTVIFSCEGGASDGLQMMGGYFDTDGAAHQASGYAYGSTEVSMGLPTNFARFRCWIRFANIAVGTYLDTTLYPMIRLSGQDSTWAGLQNTSLTTSWQTEAGTVYSGTIDVATGLLTVDRAMVDISSLSWYYDTNNALFAVDLSNIKGGYSWSSEITDVITSVFKYKGANVGWGGMPNNSFGIATKNFRVKCTEYTEPTAFKNAFAGQTIVYPLATPQTYQLTPQQIMTLLGTNNVWADTGNVSVTYPADTKMYIQNLTQPTEDDLVANQAITSGKYFMIGNSLYLALANIASGAQITIGTNAQRVSLADALNTINA